MEAAAIIIGSTFKVPGEWDPQMMSYPFFTVTARSSVLKTINGLHEKVVSSLLEFFKVNLSQLESTGVNLSLLEST